LRRLIGVPLGILVGIVLIVIGVLYATGAVHWGTTPGPHYKHAILFIVLGLLAFVAANFARRSRR